MDNYLVKELRNNLSYVYSGEDYNCFKKLVTNELTNASSDLQVMIAFEEIQPEIARILSECSRKYRILSSSSKQFYPVFRNSLINVYIVLGLLKIYGYSQAKIHRIHSYIIFLMNLEELEQGKASAFTPTLVFKYASLSKVENTINTLWQKKVINQSQQRYLLQLYAEVKADGPVLEDFLRMHLPASFRQDQYTDFSSITDGSAVCFFIPAHFQDKDIEALLYMIARSILDTASKGRKVNTAIFEGRHQYKNELLQFLGMISGSCRITFYTRDYYSGHSHEWQESVCRYYDAWLFSRHSNMTSCEAISNSFGTIPVTRQLYSYDEDRRIGSSKLIDMLFNTNKVDHYANQAPSWEPVYRKEEIFRLPDSTCLVKINGRTGFLQL